MAARQRSVARTISVWARRSEVVDTLQTVDWCDQANADLATCCSGSELIILCAPVKRIIEICHLMAPLLDSCPIVTDVGSVKADICHDCSKSLGAQARFVGSHPMAGSEKTGMENAFPELFQDSSCFVTPVGTTDPQATETVASFWKALGSAVHLETPRGHDAIVAQLSHVPHIISAALASSLERATMQAKDFCGNGLKDTTRIAAGDPGLWQEIITQNRSEVLAALSQFEDEITRFRNAIEAEDTQAIESLLAQGKRFRDRIQ